LVAKSHGLARDTLIWGIVHLCLSLGSSTAVNRVRFVGAVGLYRLILRGSFEVGLLGISELTVARLVTASLAAVNTKVTV